MDSRRFGFDAGLVLTSSVSVMFIGVLINILLGRTLGGSGLGLYTIVLTLYGILSLIGEFGITAAIVRYAAAYKNNREELNRMVSYGIFNSVFFGFIIFILLYITSDTFAVFYNMPKLSGLLKLISIIFPFFFITDILIFVLNGLRKIKSYAFFIILRRVLVLIFTFSFLKMGWDTNGAVIALVISMVITSIVLLIYSKNYITFQVQNYIGISKKLLNFGGKIFFANAVNMINTTAGTLLIGYFLLDKDVGIYAIAVMFGNLLMLIPNATDTIVYPTISEYNAGKTEYNSIEKMVNKIIKYSLISLSLLATLIMLFGKEIILLLFPNRPEFLQAMPAIIILTFGIIIYGSIGSVGSIFSGMNRPDIPLKVSIIAAVSNLFLNILLIPELGINGAALATAVSFSIFAISEIYFIQSILKIKLEIHQLLRFFIMFLPIYPIFNYLDNFLGEIPMSIAGLSLYIVILYYSKIINYDDKKFILGIFKIAK